jgi:hypothetical protein
MGVFGALINAALLLARRQGRALPKAEPVEILLVGMAAHKVSRIVAKDKVASPIRDSFAGMSGVRGAFGELLTCPYCLGLWASTIFAVGQIFAPRVTRFAISIFAMLTVSDFLHIARRAAEVKSGSAHRS